MKKTIEKLKGSAAQKERLKAEGTFNGWKINPSDYYSPRSDPGHDEHANWLSRTALSNPKMIELLASMREHGTDQGEPVLVYTRDDKRYIADGDRRQAACLIVNAERKKGIPEKGLPQLVLRALTTTDPVLARNLGNACREDDPPLVWARRFRAALGSMDPGPAAACCGLRLDTANTLVKCLLLPEELQARINARELAPDVALRLAKKMGSAAASKVPPAEAKAAAKVERPKSPGRREVKRVEAGLRERGTPEDLIAVDVIAWLRGGGPRPTWLPAEKMTHADARRRMLAPPAEASKEAAE